MKIIWNGHACFTLETAEGSVVFDPYEDGSVPGLPPLKLTADEVLCTHGHGDHCAADKVTLTGRRPEYTVEVLDTFHDNAGGVKRGPNRMYMISAEGLRVAHLGDLGCELTESQVDALRGVDALLIPVGGFFTIDAAAADRTARRVQARVVIPMHYSSDRFGYDVIGGVEDFLALRDDVTVYAGNTLELTKDTPAQTAVLNCL